MGAAPLAATEVGIGIVIDRHLDAVDSPRTHPHRISLNVCGVLFIPPVVIFHDCQRARRAVDNVPKSDAALPANNAIAISKLFMYMARVRPLGTVPVPATTGLTTIAVTGMHPAHVADIISPPTRQAISPAIPTPSLVGHQGLLWITGTE